MVSPCGLGVSTPSFLGLPQPQLGLSPRDGGRSLSHRGSGDGCRQGSGLQRKWQGKWVSVTVGKLGAPGLLLELWGVWPGLCYSILRLGVLLGASSSLPLSPCPFFLPPLPSPSSSLTFFHPPLSLYFTLPYIFFLPFPIACLFCFLINRQLQSQNSGPETQEV